VGLLDDRSLEAPAELGFSRGFPLVHRHVSSYADLRWKQRPVDVLKSSLQLRRDSFGVRSTLDLVHPQTVIGAWTKRSKIVGKHNYL
jgi:hypothetical protein